MPMPQEKYYTADDFYNMPDDIRAELIEGQIICMASPSTQHQRILSRLHIAIGNYINAKSGKCEVFPAPFGVQLHKNKDTIVEPDISVICDPDKLTERGCLGAPDWVIEITSPSNPSHDYITKLSLYSAAGVSEYWIVDPQSRQIHVYFMEPSSFQLKSYSFEESIQVGIYNDLTINLAAFGL